MTTYAEYAEYVDCINMQNMTIYPMCVYVCVFVCVCVCVCVRARAHEICRIIEYAEYLYIA